MKYNKQTLTAARLAWNDLTRLMDPVPSTYTSDEEFDKFYSVLVEKLFEDNTKDPEE